MWPTLRHHTKTSPISMHVDGPIVRMLQLGGDPDHRSVSACAEWQCPQDLADRILWQEVAGVWQEGGFEGRRLVLTLPCDAISVRSVDPGRHVEPTSANITDVIAQQSPHAGYAWPLTMLAPSAMEGLARITYVAAEAATVDAWQDKLHALGGLITAVEPRPLAAFNALRSFLRRRSDHHRTHVLVDIGHEATAVIVAIGAQPYFLKILPTGERHLAEAIAGVLDISVDDVRHLRRRIRREELAEAAAPGSGAVLTSQSDSLAWAFYDAGREAVEALVFEVGLSLRHCQTTYGMPALEHIWLSGEAAEDTSLHHLLGERLGLAVYVVEPFKGIDVSHSSLCSDRRGTLTEWSSGIGALRPAVIRPEILVGTGLASGEMRE